MRKIALAISLLGFIVGTAQAQAAHSNTLNASDTSCTTATGKTCTLQVWKAPLASGNCSMSLSYTQIASAVTGTATATTTVWQYVDTANLVEGQTNCYYVTATYTAGGGPSAASNIFQGQTPYSAPATAPVLTGTSQ